MLILLAIIGLAIMGRAVGAMVEIAHELHKLRKLAEDDYETREQ